MANRVPLTIEIDEPVVRAANLRAAREGCAPAELISDILRKALASEIQEANGIKPLAEVIQGVIKEQPKT